MTRRSPTFCLFMSDQILQPYIKYCFDLPSMQPASCSSQATDIFGPSFRCMQPWCPPLNFFNLKMLYSTYCCALIACWDLQALTHCDAFIRGLPGVVREAVGDTAAAAKTISENGWRCAVFPFAL